MGYRIQYGQTMTKELIADEIPKKRPLPIVSLIFLICIVFTLLYTFGVDTLRDYMIPGNDKVTEAALSSFAKDISDGEPVGEAFAAFCREIIENANIPE